jgi:TRAP-type C4-dicarboxylate transport system permease small subunit
MERRPSVLECFVAGLMTALVALVFTQVLVRYLTYQPLAWTEEAARYVFIWLCLLGAAVAARRGQHFVVDFAQRALPAGAFRIAAVATKVVEAAFYGLVVVAGIKVLGVVHLQQSPSLEIPMSIPYLAIPLGAALMAATATWRAWAIWFKQKS